MSNEQRDNEQSWNWAQFTASGRPGAPSFYLGSWEAELQEQRHRFTDSKVDESTAVIDTVSQVVACRS